MSGDSESGVASFIAKDSTITTNKGDTIFVTNTSANIELQNTSITNNDSEGDFLRIQAGKWGSSGSNGGNVTLSMSLEQITGDVIVDNISKLDLSLSNNSVLIGAINKDNQGDVKLKLSGDSILSLTNDTYVNSLENDDTTNANIYSNGEYKLYVNGDEAHINSDSYMPTDVTIDTDDNSTNNSNLKYFIVGSIIVLIVGTGLVVFFLDKRKNKSSL